MLHTAEAVAIGHPDKVCDQIADALLDECLSHDPGARCAIEVMGGHGKLFILGELTTRAELTDERVREIALATYRSVGHTDNLDINVTLVKQSPEIGQGVDKDGAGDQGIMVGYATAETPEFLPLEVVIARHMARAMGNRDGKSQVTIENGRVTSFLTSVCGEYPVELYDVVDKHIVPMLAPGISPESAWAKNPNGPWTIGGFAADSGLTGRKIVVDAYGPRIPVGGGAFSGKDATKVDRSGAYMARKVAADYVRLGAKEAKVSIAYAIGQADPVAAWAEIEGVEEKIHGYDLRPRAIIEQLDLRKPQYLKTAALGHFGNGYLWD